MSGNIYDTKPAQVLNDITAMRKDLYKSNKKQLDYYKEKYTHLAQFPTLIEKVYDGMNDEDLNRIRNMIIGVSNIQHGKISKEEASVKMGEVLAERYLYPVVGKSDRKISVDEAKSMLNAASGPGPTGSIPLKEFLEQNKKTKTDENN